MERVPPKLPNTSSRLIAMAASLIGDLEAVCKEIGCSQPDFEAYCESEKELPWLERERLVEIIIREQKRLIAKNRELIAQINARQLKSVD